jgi:hypothetical protein
MSTLTTFISNDFRKGKMGQTFVTALRFFSLLTFFLKMNVFAFENRYHPREPHKSNQLHLQLYLKINKMSTQQLMFDLFSLRVIVVDMKAI